MSQSNVAGYIEDDPEHSRIFPERYTPEEFQKRFPNGVFMNCYEGDIRGSEYWGWVDIRVKDGRLWIEWGEPAA